MSEKKIPPYLTGEDILELSRDDTVKLRGIWGRDMFYRWKRNNNDEPLRGKFVPSLLSAYFNKVHHVKTIRPINARHRGDMYRYDYDKTLYVLNAEIHFRELIKAWWRDQYDSIPKIKVWDDLAASTYIDRKDFELDSKYIPVANGIVVLKNDKNKFSLDFIEHSPDFLVSSCITTKYDPNASAPNFYKFLNEILPNQPRDQIWIQEWTGSCLYREQIFDRALVLIGKGDNGKTTLLSVIRAMLGLRNTVEMSLHSLSNNRFCVAELYHKHANIGDDLSPRDLRYIDTFLKLTGGTNQMFAERKGKDPFYLNPICKHAWPANLLPAVKYETNAFYRRWLTPQFYQVFTKDEVRKNKIMRELTTPEELSGILNWALEGLINILNNDGFTNPPTIDHNRSLWRSRSGNAVIAYIYSGGVEKGSESLYLMSDFMKDTNMFAITNEIPTMTSTRMGITLKNVFPEIFKERRTYNGEQLWFYKGIAPKGREYILDIDEEKVGEAYFA